MKLNPLFVFIILMMTFTNSHAQIIYSENKMGININPAKSPFDLTINNWNSIRLNSGTNGRLDVQFKGGITNICGSQDIIRFYNPNSNNYTQIRAEGFYQWIDKNKTEEEMGHSLSKLLKIKPVLYHKTIKFEPIDPIFDIQDTSESFEKIVPLNQPAGFNFESLEKAFPNVLIHDKTESSCLDVAAWLPYLVKSIQELHNIVEEQGVLIESLLSKQITSEDARSLGKILTVSPNPSIGPVEVII